MWWSSSSSGGYKFAERFCPWHEAGSGCQVWPEHLLGCHHHHHVRAAAAAALRRLRRGPQGRLLVWHPDCWPAPHRLVPAEQEDSQSAWRYQLCDTQGTHQEVLLSCVSWAGSLCSCCGMQVLLLRGQAEVICCVFLKYHDRGLWLS